MKLFMSQVLDSNLEDITVVDSNFKKMQISSASLYFKILIGLCTLNPES